MDNPSNPKTIIMPPLSAIDAERIVHTEVLQVVTNPEVKEIIQTLAVLAKFMNRFVAECLKSGVVSAANPATAALMNASATVEQGAIQLDQLAKQQSGFVAPGQGGGRATGPGSAGPFRTN